MTPELETAIRGWHERSVEAEEMLCRLDDVLDLAPESPLRGVVWSLIGALRTAIGEPAGVDGWLEWWSGECNFGNSPMRAGIVGEPMRLISTIDDLLNLIRDDLASVKP